MTDTISENNFLFSVYYCYLLTEKINTLQEMSFIIGHIDIISCEEELWENWISLQGNKDSNKRIPPYKDFEPKYLFQNTKP